MAEIIIRTTIQLKRGMAEAWQRVNPTLCVGEPGFEIDTNKLKIGDGVTPYNDLDYISGGYSVSPDGKSLVINSDNKMMLYGYDSAEVGQVPTKDENGYIKWVEPSGDEPLSEEEILHILV